MKQHKSFLLCIPFYLITLVCLGIYMFIEFSPRILLNPVGRLILLGIFCICCYAGSLFLCKHKTIPQTIVMKATFWIFFLCYVGLLLTLTLFDPMFGRGHGLSFIFTDRPLMNNYLQNNFNLVPFRTIAKYITAPFTGEANLSIVATNLLGNLAAFVPMAFFLPLLFSRCHKFPAFLLFTALSVLAVELLQLILVVGICDIDDLILNTCGACAVYWFLRIKPIQKLIQNLTRLPY